MSSSIKNFIKIIQSHMKLFTSLIVIMNIFYFINIYFALSFYHFKISVFKSYLLTENISEVIYNKSVVNQHAFRERIINLYPNFGDKKNDLINLSINNNDRGLVISIFVKNKSINEYNINDDFFKEKINEFITSDYKSFYLDILREYRENIYTYLQGVKQSNEKNSYLNESLIQQNQLLFNLDKLISKSELEKKYIPFDYFIETKVTTYPFIKSFLIHNLSAIIIFFILYFFRYNFKFKL